MSVDVLTGEIVEVLTGTEEDECERYETAIANGLRWFRVVGPSLAAVRDGRLYRNRYATFDTYCEDMWGFTRRHVDRLIVAATVAEILEVDEVGPIGLTSESQARELVPLVDDPEALREVYEEALDAASGEPTAKDLRDAVKRHTKPAERPAPAPDQRSAHEKRAAAQAHTAAEGLARTDRSLIDEKTVRLLEALCRKWRDTNDA